MSREKLADAIAAEFRIFWAYRENGARVRELESKARLEALIAKVRDA